MISQIRFSTIFWEEIRVESSPTVLLFQTLRWLETNRACRLPLEMDGFFSKDDPYCPSFWK